MQGTSEPIAAEKKGDQRQEIKLARRCFVQVDRLTSLMMAYPPGHPIVEDAATMCVAAFKEYFELSDRLSVLVDAHSLKYLGTEERVWETEDPRDYCWVMSRDGVYLLHLLAGIDEREIRHFVDILNDLVDERDLSRNAVTILFEAGFRYVSYDALDESLAQLAGLDLDIRDRDTKEEQEAIEDLFENAFDQEANKQMSPEQASQKQQQEFQLRMQKRSERQERMDVGSRQFLLLNKDQQKHLFDLKRGFTEHAELEHREGEILAAILGAKPKAELREQSVEQIGEVMGTLLETQRPWESLEFLKLIHEWRANFDQLVTEDLKRVVSECFTQRRLSGMIKMVATSEPPVRRAILQMFNALNLGQASGELAKTLAWDLSDEVRKDVLRYLNERSKYSVGFLRDAVFDLPTDKVGPILDMLTNRMPKSKDILISILEKPSEPTLKVRAVNALSGHWAADEPERIMAPFLSASHAGLRLAALRGLADASPKVLPRHLGPLFTSSITSRPEEEIREMATLHLKHGGASALEQFRELIHKRGIVNNADIELASLLAKMIARNPQPGVVELLSEVGSDWLVAGKIRSTCKELASLMQK
jgi:hypothetical protein